jgi:general secretion pathway protein G
MIARALLALAIFFSFPLTSIDQSGNALRAREATLREDLFRMRDAIAQHAVDRGNGPASLQELVARGYLREIPRDPMTRTAAWTELRVGQVLVDVRSRSLARAMDGSAYAIW